MSEEIWPPTPINRADVERRVIRVVLEGTDLKDVTTETEIDPSADLDSLEDVELIMSLEEEFDVEIPNEAVQQLFSRTQLTVGDLVELVLHYVPGN